MPLSKEEMEALTKGVAAIMTDARADADAGSKLDKVLSAMDAFCGRMDAMEKRMDTETEEKKKADSKKADSKKDEDGEMIAADEDEEEEKKKKADAEEKEAKEKADAAEEEKKKADAAVKENAELKARLEAVERNLPKQLTDEDRHAFSAAQARADDVYSQFGKRAPQALNGETVMAYRQRLVAGLKDHSPSWKAVDVLAIADAATFEIAEKAVFGDAVIAARAPADLKQGQLRAISRNDANSGHRITEYVGRGSFIHSMTRSPRHVGRINVGQTN